MDRLNLFLRKVIKRFKVLKLLEISEQRLGIDQIFIDIIEVVQDNLAKEIELVKSFGQDFFRNLVGITFCVKFSQPFVAHLLECPVKYLNEQDLVDIGHNLVFDVEQCGEMFQQVATGSINRRPDRGLNLISFLVSHQQILVHKQTGALIREHHGQFREVFTVVIFQDQIICNRL